MARITLSGKMGKASSATFGADLIASEELVDGKWYVVMSIDDSSSGLDANAVVGYMFRSDGTETLSGDDIVRLVTFVDKCDVQAWSLSFTKEDIDVSSLCDKQGKVFIPGDTDIEGSLTGIFKIGTTDAVGGIQNMFVDIVQASGTYAVNKILEEILYLRLLTQDSTNSGETEQFYLVPATLNSFNQGATRGEAQAFESGFKPTADEENGVKLAYYSYTHA